MVRLQVSDGKPAADVTRPGSPHASCSYSGVERRELPAHAIEGQAALKPPSKSSRNAPHPTTRKRPWETLRPFAPRTQTFGVSGCRRCLRGS